MYDANQTARFIKELVYLHFVIPRGIFASTRRNITSASDTGGAVGPLWVMTLSEVLKPLIFRDFLGDFPGIGL